MSSNHSSDSSSYSPRLTPEDTQQHQNGPYGRWLDTVQDEATQPKKQPKSALVHFTFLENPNNTVPVRVTEEDGSPVDMYMFLSDVSHAAMLLLNSRVGARGNLIGETGRYIRSVIHSSYSVAVRWDLGGGLFGWLGIPVLDSEVTWAETANLLGDSAGRHCVVVNLPFEKEEWLRDMICRADSQEEYSDEEYTEDDPEEDAEDRGPLVSGWVPIRR